MWPCNLAKRPLFTFNSVRPDPSTGSGQGTRCVSKGQRELVLRYLSTSGKESLALKYGKNSLTTP